MGVIERILIVDDEKTVLFSMRHYFNTLGYEVDCASDLATAKALLQETAYPVVFTDLRLGGSDNRDGLEIIRCTHGRYPNARIVLLTGYGSPALTAEARSLGADAVFSKPMPLLTLAQFVSNS